KQLVPLGVEVPRNCDWATDGVSENILFEGGLSRAEVIAGVKCIVAKIFVRHAMEGVGPRFSLQKQHIRAIQSVLGAKVVLQNLDFLNRVRIGCDRGLVHTTGIHIPNTVKIVLCARYAHPVYGDRVRGEETTLVECRVWR